MMSKLAELESALDEATQGTLRTEVAKLLAETHQELEKSKDLEWDEGDPFWAAQYHGESCALKRMVVKLQRMLAEDGR